MMGARPGRMVRIINIHLWTGEAGYLVHLCDGPFFRT